MTRFRLIFAFVLLGALAACSQNKAVWASDEEVAKWAYVHDAPPSITLVTVINNRDGSGGHSALLINAHQRVVFDPAGNWKSKFAPERNDFVYGMHPEILDRYIDFHARTTWHVVMQEKIVTSEVAELLFQMAKENGNVASAFCGNSVSHLLQNTPGFENIKVSLFPKKIMENFASLPGVTRTKIVQMD